MRSCPAATRTLGALLCGKKIECYGALSVCMQLWITLLLACCATGIAKEDGKICSSRDIRNNVETLQKLNGCRVVEGFVRVVLIDRANESEYDKFTFPELREITGYLLIYRVTGLTSLGRLFPNLTVIRGNSLFVDYALVVYEMSHLQVRKHFIHALLSSGEITVAL
jgi:insulin receptor